MMTARLKKRCCSAKAIGLASADGYKLTFWKPSTDGSGKGHLVEGEGVSQPGVLFEIDMDEQKTLDKFEGVGDGGYRREDSFAVRKADTYLATHPKDSLRPYDWYLALIVMGGRQHGVPSEVIDPLLRTRYDSDTDLERKTRCQAMCLLKAAGTDIERALRRRPT